MLEKTLICPRLQKVFGLKDIFFLEKSDRQEAPFMVFRKKRFEREDFVMTTGLGLLILCKNLDKIITFISLQPKLSKCGL
jgi:hypothetical protein